MGRVDFFNVEVAGPTTFGLGPHSHLDIKSNSTRQIEACNMNTILKQLFNLFKTL